MAFTILKPSNIFCLLILLLVLHSPTSCKADNILYSGETLNAGYTLLYGQNYKLVMQIDCNLVLYDNNKPVWASNTGGLSQYCRCTLRRDGNLVIRNPAGGTIWTSNTAGRVANYVLILQKDRNVVIYGPNVWATNTDIRNVWATNTSTRNVSDAAPAVAVVNNNTLGRKAKFTSPEVLESVVGAVVN